MRYLLVLVLLCGCTSPDYSGIVAVSVGVTSDGQSPDPTPTPKPGICENCNGTGKLGDGTVVLPCPACNGTGKVTTETMNDVWNWYQELDKAKVAAEMFRRPLLVVFSSKTCNPCNALSSQQGKEPTKSLLINHYIACKLYAQDELKPFQDHDIRNYPTQIIFVDDAEFARREGFSSRSLDDYHAWLMAAVD